MRIRWGKGGDGTVGKVYVTEKEGGGAPKHRGKKEGKGEWLAEKRREREPVTPDHFISHQKKRWVIEQANDMKGHSGTKCRSRGKHRGVPDTG